MAGRETAYERVRAQMRLILPQYPDGMRAKEATERIHRALNGEVKKGTVRGQLATVAFYESDEFGHERKAEPEKGVYYFRKVSTQTQQSNTGVAPVGPPEQAKEEDYYEPFAEYLVQELYECGKAISVGGKKFKDFWATPDVVGLSKSEEWDVAKFQEVVSAEIKKDNAMRDLMTAFGQACAYRLFSHKVYLVIPQITETVERSRLRKLCHTAGIGLVFFETGAEIDSSIFSLEILAQRHQPDMAYLNKYMEYIKRELLRSN